jgi:protein involved in polysaccharide export with SLBB domain
MLLLVAPAVLFVSACANSQERGDVAKSRPVGQIGAPVYLSAQSRSADYRIQPGDRLGISLYLDPEFNEKVTVRPDGKIDLLVVGEVLASGKTPVQLSAELDRFYSVELLHPDASVKVINSPGEVVYVAGEVSHPGVIPLRAGMTALQAITASGGLTDNAGANHVVLVRHDIYGETVREELDLSEVLSKPTSDEDAALAPTDIVIVPRSGIANVDLIVKQYIKDVLPFQPYAPIF